MTFTRRAVKKGEKEKIKLLGYIKKHRKVFNEVSIVINLIFLSVLFFEFFFPHNEILKNIQIWLWVYFLLEFYMRLKVHKFKTKYVFSLISLLDIIIITAIFVRFYYVDNTILHFFTALKILRSYRVIHDLSKVSNFFSRNKDLIFSILNLLIFTFFMASLVFIAQVDINKDINSFLDALYFTISTLTTTWFWDIVVIWDRWKVLVVLIMTLWAWLFLRMITIIFRPIKKYNKCKHCGLKRHDRDASHCKHCWKIIYIEHIWEIIE